MFRVKDYWNPGKEDLMRAVYRKLRYRNVEKPGFSVKAGF